MLDTGATFSVFTPLFVRSLGVTVRRTKSTPYRRATKLGRDLQFFVDTESSDTGSRTNWEYGYPNPAAYQVTGVLPDTPASRLGLQAGDVFHSANRGTAPVLSELVEQVTAGRPIRVMRRTADDEWVEIALPAGSVVPSVPVQAGDGHGAALPASASRSGESDEQRRARLADEAHQRDSTRSERWEKQKEESLYFRGPDGGWMKVDSRRRREGPKSGEVWVGFDEMQRIKSERIKREEVSR